MAFEKADSSTGKGADMKPKTSFSISFWFIFCTLSIAAVLTFQYSARAYAIEKATAATWTGQHISHSAGLEAPWNVIEPSQRLVYSKCYGRYECARIELPMDWNASSSENIALALIRLPAVVPVTDPRYGGAVIIMPGGPGVSGVNRILEQGDKLRMMIDSQSPPSATDISSAEQKYFDIISYDPRGVANSTPPYRCFSEPLARQRWSIEDSRLDVFGTSEVASRHVWARSKALAATCTGRGSPRIGAFMNTAPQVADLVAVIERHGQWREQHANALLKMDQISTGSEKAETRARCRWRKGCEKLQYWGYSYATTLGATFAAMHPFKVKRMILDAVTDTPTIYDGRYVSSINDADLVMDAFFDSCAQAGPERCAFAADASDTLTIRTKLDDILQKLNHTPLAVAATQSRGPDTITYSDVLRVVKLALYTPESHFAILSALLQDIAMGNGTIFADRKAAETPLWRLKPLYSELEFEVLTSIICTDAMDLRPLGESGFLAFAAIVKEQSRWLGDIWPTFQAPCFWWDVRPRWRFEGEVATNTVIPLLWIGNTRDPATPLQNAYSMAAKFPGSEVLVYDYAGHGTYSSSSDCVASYTRNYFVTGTLPPPGTHCLPNRQPFDE